jgi:hypothetical protein
MGRPVGSTKRFCRNGHDTELTGRWASGTCRECQRRYNRTERIRERGGLPASRLRGVAGGQLPAALAWAKYRGVDWEAARQHAQRLYKTKYLSIDAADCWCIALGTTLYLVYPEVYTMDTPTFKAFYRARKIGA